MFEQLNDQLLVNSKSSLTVVGKKVNDFNGVITQGLLDLDGRNSQKYLPQT